MSEYAFQRIFGESAQGQPFIGTHALEKLEKYPVRPENTRILFDGSGITLQENTQADSPDYSWREFNREQTLQTLISFAGIAEADLSIVECIVLPLDLQAVLESGGIFNNASFELIPREEISARFPSRRAVESEIIAFLSEKHGDFTYETGNKIEEYLKNSKDLSSSLIILSWVAKYSLLIITVGMTGLMLILLDRRKRDMAISLIVGAVKWKLAVELMTELLLLCGSGCVIAALASLVITPGLGSSQYQAVVTGQSLLAIAGVSLVVAVTSCLLSLASVRMKNPVETLREE